MFYICLNQKQYIMTLDEIRALAVNHLAERGISDPRLVEVWVNGYLKGRTDGIDKAKELISTYS